MSAMRKPVHDHHGDHDLRRVGPPEAYDYSGPLDYEALERHRQDAAARLGNKPRRVIDGLEWSRLRELVKEPT